VKKNLRLKNGISLLLVMIIALFLSACGSSSTTGEKAAPLAYDGITDPAVITAENAEELTSKSVGLGFMNDLALVTSGLNTETSASTKKSTKDIAPGCISGLAGLKLYQIYSRIADDQGAVVDITDLARKVRSHNYPDSGSFEDTLQLVHTANTSTFTGDLVFENAGFYKLKGSGVESYDTTDGTVTVNFVFDITKENPTESFDCWDDFSNLTRLEKLLDRPSTYPVITELYTYGDYKNQQTFVNDISEFAGEDGRYGGFGGTEWIEPIEAIVANESETTFSMVIDGDFAKKSNVLSSELGLSSLSVPFENTGFQNEYHGGEAAFYGSNKLSESLVFTGNMTLTEETHFFGYGSGYGGLALKRVEDEILRESSLKVSLYNGSISIDETSEEIFAKPSDTTITCERNEQGSMSMSGKINIDYSFSDTTSAVEITGTINGTVDGTFSETDLETRTYIDDYTRFNFNPEELVNNEIPESALNNLDYSNLESKEVAEQFTQTITGSAVATATTTKKNAPVETDVFPWEKETTHFELINGKMETQEVENGSLAQTWQVIPEPVEEEATKKAAKVSSRYEESEIVIINQKYLSKRIETKDESETTTISGTAKISRNDNFVEVSGEIVETILFNFNDTDNFVWDSDAEDIDNFVWAPGSNDVIDGINIDAEENFSDIKTFNNVAFRTDAVDMMVQGTIESINADDDDYKYDADATRFILDLVLMDSISGSSYKLEDYTIIPEDEVSKGSDTMYISLDGRFYHSAFGYVDVSTLTTPFAYTDGYLYEGTATVTGVEGTKAIVEIKTDDDDNTSYSVVADTNGDGSFDFGPAITVFPDMEATVKDFWLYDAGVILGTLADQYRTDYYNMD